MADSKKKKYANPEAVTETIKAIRKILGNVSSAGIEDGGNFIAGSGQSIVSALFALDEAVSGKADKATTLAGYGITDKLFKSLGANAACEDTAGWGVFKIVVDGYAPYTYGTILQWEATDNYDKKPSEGGWYVQLFAATESKGLWLRTRTNGNAWKPWVQLAIADDISGKADKVSVEIADLGGDKSALYTLSTVNFGKVYKIQNGWLNSLTIKNIEYDDVYNNNEHREVLIEFDCGADDITLSVSGNLMWANDEAPTFKSGWHYQLSITRWVDIENVNTYYQGVCVGFPM